MSADPRLPEGSGKCRCAACGEYFNSESIFDRHRAGDFRKGPGARRCLTREEMAARGYARSATGHWIRNPRTAFPGATA